MVSHLAQVLVFPASSFHEAHQQATQEQAQISKQVLLAMRPQSFEHLGMLATVFLNCLKPFHSEHLA